MKTPGRFILLLAVLITVGIGAVWFFVVPPRAARLPAFPAGMAEVLKLNNQGVGWIEQFDYPGAEKAFRRVVDKAPDWLPGRINLAIALLNQNSSATLDEASNMLRGVLAEDPDNPYAHYSLGIILTQNGGPASMDEACQHFAAVTRIDPRDPGGWYQLGKCREADDPEAAQAALRKAIELDPYLSSAVYGLAMLENRSGRRDEGQRLLAEHQRLRSSDWDSTIEIKYGRMGRYAEVIGRAPKQTAQATAPLPLFEPVEALQVTLAEATRWATRQDFHGDSITELRGRAFDRFGITSATLDFDGDGRTDVLLLGAVVRDGKLADVLLRNDGAWHFSDVTAAAGLAGDRASLGCAIGDFDNDGRPDLVISGAGILRLFRNTGGKFEDVTDVAGISSEPIVHLGAAFVDLDQDGDLDLYVANYCKLEDAAQAFTDELPAAVANSFYMNVGEARTMEADESEQDGAAPLSAAFRAVSQPASLVDGEHSVGIAIGDFDNDRDVDLCLIQDQAPATLILNDRVMRFHRQTIDASVLPLGSYNGAVAADLDKDGRPDLWVVAAGAGRARLLLNRGSGDGGVRFEAGTTNAEAMPHARLIDLDLDGWFDIAGVSRGAPVLVRNEGGRMVQMPDAFGWQARQQPAGPPGTAGSAAAGPGACVIADLDGDGPADLLMLGEHAAALRNRGNGNHWIKLALTGKREVGKEMRTNRDAVAARFTLHASDLWVQAEQGSQIAGLGQSYEPILIGLGPRSDIDVVRVRWPDGTLQAEFQQGADRLVVLGQQQRKTISCPLLFTWNGSRFEYIADFLGGGGLGYLIAPGTYAQPDPDEAVKIDPGKLVPNGGRYVVKIVEPMDEVTYLDRLTLVAIDHPADLTVQPNERFAPPESRPDGRLYAYRDPIFPVRATDHRGRDVTDKLRHWDRSVVDGFRLRGSWVGYAEPHWIVLDFADRLAGFAAQDPLVLYLAGWVEYPYSQTNYAAATAGVTFEPPRIERLGHDGAWETIFPVAGFPAGSPKMMTLDVTGRLGGPRCVLRIATNAQVYWDQIFVAPAEETAALPMRELPVIDAELGYRGHLAEFSPDGDEPTVHDYHHLSAVPLVRQAGNLTRYGAVRDLLNDEDDRFVIFGAGDELTVDFDATQLPDLPEGWRRSFVLRSWGYCKSADVLTALSDTVEPLPFRGMSGYPFRPDEHPADAAAQEAYRRAFNTRSVEKP